MTSNAQYPNEEVIKTSSTPSKPTAAVETSSSTGSLQTDNPQSGSSYRERDGLSDKVRINTLIYVMGNNAANV